MPGELLSVSCSGVRGLHPDTFFSVGLLILFPAVTIGTVLLGKLMMARAALALVGVAMAIILRMSEGAHGLTRCSAEDGQEPSSAEQRARIEVALDRRSKQSFSDSHDVPRVWCARAGSTMPTGAGGSARSGARTPAARTPLRPHMQNTPVCWSNHVCSASLHLKGHLRTRD